MCARRLPVPDLDCPRPSRRRGRTRPRGRARITPHLIFARRDRINVPPFFWPLAAYAGITLVSAAFSIEPRVSLADCKQLVLFLTVPLVFRFITSERATTMITVILSFAAASAAYGIVQYAMIT